MLALMTEQTHPSAELAQLLRDEGHSLEVGKDEHLWSLGDSVATLYVVRVGLVRLVDTRRNGDVVTILAVGPNGVLGAHPLLGFPTAATGAETVLASQLTAVPFDKVRVWQDEHAFSDAELSEWLLRDLRRHLADTYMRLGLGQASASERLARVVLSLNAQNLLPHVSRRHLAELSNLTVETVVRTLKMWLNEGGLQSRHLNALSAEEKAYLNELLGAGDRLTLPYS